MRAGVLLNPMTWLVLGLVVWKAKTLPGTAVLGEIPQTIAGVFGCVLITTANAVAGDGTCTERLLGSIEATTLAVCPITTS
jgi:hypothetical protein